MILDEKIHDSYFVKKNKSIAQSLNSLVFYWIALDFKHINKGLNF